MAIRQEKYVFIYPVHIELWVMFHDVEVKGSEKFGAAERAARMATCAPVHHPYNVASYLCRDALQIFHVDKFNWPQNYGNGQ